MSGDGDDGYTQDYMVALAAAHKVWATADKRERLVDEVVRGEHDEGD